MPRLDLDTLFRLYRRDILRFVRSRLGAENAVAPDLTQEVFLRAYERFKGDQIRDERSFLFAMAANLSTDHLRIERRRRQILDGMTDAPAMRGEDITPERIAAVRSDLAWVFEELRKMPARQRYILLRYHLDGRTQRQVAEELGLGLSTVRADLKAAIAALVDARRRAYPL